MVVKYNSDILSGLLFLVIASVIWFLIPIQIDTMETTEVTARTIPSIVTGGMFLFSLCLLLQGIFKTPKKTLVVTRESFRTAGFKKEMRSLIYVSLFIVYAVLLTFVGYLISTALLAAGILLYYRARKWYYYAISLGTVGIVYCVFTFLLDVTLP